MVGCVASLLCCKIVVVVLPSSFWVADALPGNGKKKFLKMNFHSRSQATNTDGLTPCWARPKSAGGREIR